jgi:uncharacterized protein (TIGR02117 family)
MRNKTLTYYLLTAALCISVIALVAFFKAWTFAPHTVEYNPQNSNNTSSISINNKNTKDNRPYIAYAVSNGWHVGVVVPAVRMNELLPDIKKRFEKTSFNSAGVRQSANYYEIGWGDQGFYEAKEITVPIAVQALFNSPGSVMHVVAVYDPAKAFTKSQLTKFCLNEAQLASLEKFIVSSFAKNAEGNIISRRPGLYGDSQFYNAAGTYHFLNSCNTWAAKALRSAGFDISPTFKLFSRQVISNIDVPACQATM